VTGTFERLSRAAIDGPVTRIPGAILAAMLHSMRRRMKDLAEREAAGASVWSEGFDDRVRTRIRHAYDADGYANRDSYHQCFVAARQMILQQEGVEWLTDRGLGAVADFAEYLRSAPDDMYPTAIEALIITLDKFVDFDLDYYGYPAEGMSSAFVASVNEILAQERVAWKIVDRMMVEMKSMELHEAVVEPALRLIHDARFSGVDATYRKALDELSGGDPADAVTDAGAAMQELLEALGCEGNSLGGLIKSARTKKILAAHDVPPLDAIKKAMAEWVSADRSETGESHHASDASRDDAWLIVHIVGAFIVRLASGGTRD